MLLTNKGSILNTKGKYQELVRNIEHNELSDNRKESLKSARNRFKKATQKNGKAIFNNNVR